MRSGTTLLEELCNSHPEIILTDELAIFHAEGKYYKQYRSRILQRWLSHKFIRRKEFQNVSGMSTRRRVIHSLHNHVYTARFLFQIRKYRRKRIDASRIETALRNILPAVQLVGDKWPHYVFLLDHLALLQDMRIVIIYRDCRDVVSSALTLARSNWREKKWIKDFDSAEKIAQSWMRAIEMMERHSENVHAIRYEDLVAFPQQEMMRLADYLGLDWTGFPIGIIKNSSVGNYKNNLTAEEMEAIDRIARTTMIRLGY